MQLSHLKERITEQWRSFYTRALQPPYNALK